MGASHCCQNLSITKSICSVCIFKLSCKFVVLHLFSIINGILCFVFLCPQYAQICFCVCHTDHFLFSSIWHHALSPFPLTFLSSSLLYLPAVHGRESEGKGPEIDVGPAHRERAAAGWIGVIDQAQSICSARLLGLCGWRLFLNYYRRQMLVRRCSLSRLDCFSAASLSPVCHAFFISLNWSAFPPFIFLPFRALSQGVIQLLFYIFYSALLYYVPVFLTSCCFPNCDTLSCDKRCVVYSCEGLKMPSGLIDFLLQRGQAAPKSHFLMFIYYDIVDRDTFKIVWIFSFSFLAIQLWCFFVFFCSCSLSTELLLVCLWLIISGFRPLESPFFTLIGPWMPWASLHLFWALLYSYGQLKLALTWLHSPWRLEWRDFPIAQKLVFPRNIQYRGKGKCHHNCTKNSSGIQQSNWVSYK